MSDQREFKVGDWRVNLLDKNIENIALLFALALFGIHIVNLVIEPSFDYFICLLVMVFWVPEFSGTYWTAIIFDSVDRVGDVDYE